MERFERIYEQHREAVGAYVRRRAAAADTDDLVAEVFLVCLRRIDEVPERELPWLYGVARRTLANARRKAGRESPLTGEVAVEPGPVADRGLAEAFLQLAESDREVLRLVAWEGLPLREAAIVLDCSPVAARVRYHRAKVRLAARLDDAAAFCPVQQGVMR